MTLYHIRLQLSVDNEWSDAYTLDCRRTRAAADIFWADALQRLVAWGERNPAQRRNFRLWIEANHLDQSLTHPWEVN